MHNSQANITSGHTSFTLSPMTLNMAQQTLVHNIVDNITNNRELMEGIAEETSDRLNDVVDSINDLKNGSEVNLADLEDQIQAIMYLESEAGNDSFVGAFSKLFTEINRRKEVLAFNIHVDNSPDGKVNLDVSSYGFTTTQEFELIPQVVTTDNGINVKVTAKKINQSNVELTLRDGDRLSFATNDESYYEAETKGAVDITIVIVKTATPIVSQLTEADGDVDNLG